jgi:alkylation response protein AidB-like acyl-CoA dehydrogenase
MYAVVAGGPATVADEMERWIDEADVDGTKYYSTGSLFAHWIPVYANDPQGRLHAAWVPADARGVMVIDDWNGMGQRTTGSGTVVFSNVVVPPSHVVPAHLIFEKTEIFGAFGQYMHACVDLGIAIAALTVSSEIFALIGSRSASDDLNLYT